MPHLPDHETHDPELVAAYAAGDATGPALDAAAALVASCPECGELHRDLRAIAAALPAMPAPVRTRDFRLSAQTAASLRPTGWRGFMALLAGPRFSLAAPLGAGLAALGLAGLLLGSGGLPLAGSASQAAFPAASAAAAAGGAGAGDGEVTQGQQAPAVVSGPGVGAPIAGPAAVDAEASQRPVALVPEAASSVTPAPSAGSTTSAYAAASAAPSDDGRLYVDRAPVPTPVLAASARNDTAVALAPAATPPTGGQIAKDADESLAATRQDAWPEVLAIVLLGLGFTLIALRVAARRVARP